MTKRQTNNDMKNPITAFLRRKRNRRLLESLQQTASIFSSFGKLEKAGLLAWNEPDRRLFIAEPLALLMLTQAEGWRNFLSNIHLWCHYNRVSDLWQGHLLGRELDAVRKARENNPALTEDEARAIRIAAREAVPPEEMSKIDTEVKGYEFFIVANAASVNAGSGATGQILAVGRYNPDNNDVDMIPWSEIADKVKRS